MSHEDIDSPAQRGVAVHGLCRQVVRPQRRSFVRYLTQTRRIHTFETSTIHNIGCTQTNCCRCYCAVSTCRWSPVSSRHHFSDFSWSPHARAEWISSPKVMNEQKWGDEWPTQSCTAKVFRLIDDWSNGDLNVLTSMAIWLWPLATGKSRTLEGTPLRRAIWAPWEETKMFLAQMHWTTWRRLENRDLEKLACKQWRPPVAGKVSHHEDAWCWEFDTKAHHISFWLVYLLRPPLQKKPSQAGQQDTLTEWDWVTMKSLNSHDTQCRYQQSKVQKPKW